MYLLLANRTGGHHDIVSYWLLFHMQCWRNAGSRPLHTVGVAARVCHLLSSPRWCKKSLMSSSHRLRGLACARLPPLEQSTAGSHNIALKLHFCCDFWTTLPAHRHCLRLQVVTQSSRQAFSSCVSTIRAVRFMKSGHDSRFASSLSQEVSSLSDEEASRVRRLAPRTRRSILRWVVRSRLWWSSLRVHVSLPYKAVAVTVALNSLRRPLSGYALFVSSALCALKRPHAA